MPPKQLCLYLCGSPSAAGPQPGASGERQVQAVHVAEGAHGGCGAPLLHASVCGAWGETKRSQLLHQHVEAACCVQLMGECPCAQRVSMPCATDLLLLCASCSTGHHQAGPPSPHAAAQGGWTSACCSSLLQQVGQSCVSHPRCCSGACWMSAGRCSPLTFAC